MHHNIQEIRLFFIAVKQTLHHFHLLQYHPATLSHLKREARKHHKLLFRASILFPEPGPISALCRALFTSGSIPRERPLCRQAQRPIIRINSARLASSVKQPAYSMVTVCEPCFSMPRICMHKCCASTITITPRVGNIL